jgi:hypothetical protein
MQESRLDYPAITQLDSASNLSSRRVRFRARYYVSVAFVMKDGRVYKKKPRPRADNFLGS